ncbi:MAG: MFS transporter [Treponema sp.]|nr:MFS transporter [Treponema sp.]
MKKIKWYVFTAFLMFTVMLYMNREYITYQPWLEEEPLEWIAYASGNGETTAIIADSARTIIVINNEGELLYKLHAGNDTSRSFVSAELVELDANNNLYVYDKIFGGAFEESTERILKYSPDGKFLGVIYSYSYINKDFIISKGKISGMASIGDILYLARLEHEGFYLDCIYALEEDEVRTYAFVEYPNAFRDLSYCRINIKNQRIVWTTKSGTILQYSFSGWPVNEIIAGDNMSPYMAVSDNDDNFIYTDILNCEIVRIDSQTEERTTLFHRPMSDGLFYYYINNNRNITYASYNSGDVLVIDSNGTCTSIDSYSYSRYDIIARRIIFSVCIVNIILLILMLVWGISFLSKQKTSGVFKQIILVALCIIFGAGISSFIILKEMQKKNTENTFNELEKISRLLAASIDIGFITSLESPGQYDSEEYIAFAEHIKTLFSELPFDGKQVYLMLWKEHNGVVYSMYDLEDALGTFYPYDEYEDSYIEEVFTSGEYNRFVDNLPSGTWEYVLGPIFDKDGNTIAAIEIGYNVKVVEEENKTMLIQVTLIVLATTAAFLLIVIECLLMLDAYRKNSDELTGNSKTELKPNMLKCIITLLLNAYKNNTVKEKASAILPRLASPVISHLVNTYKANFSSVFHPELLRAAAFFMFFSANFATALLPMYAAGLYIPIFNLPREFIVTLPFTANVVFMIIALLVIPGILEKAGAKKISFVSAILFLTGNILCIIAENIIHLSIAYGLMGLACGAFGLIFNTIIGSQKNPADMNSGFAHYNASYLAGVNVGVVFGSIIAQFFPYRTVFWFASGIALLFLIIIVFSLRSRLLRHYYDVQYTKEESAEKFAFVKFIFRPVVLCTLLLALMPIVVSMSFMEYFMPIFGTENGLGEANIGQLMLLNGLFAILFGASLCKFVSKKIPILITILFPLLLDAGALYLFSLNVSINMLIVTIILLAIVNIFASTNIQTYYTLLYQDGGIPSVKALGSYSVIENLSMAIGPIIFSYILANDISTGMTMLAATMLGCIIVFTVVSRLSVKWNDDTLNKIME